MGGIILNILGAMALVAIVWCIIAAFMAVGK